MNKHSEPSVENQFFCQHVTILQNSFRHWTGQDLWSEKIDMASQIYAAPFAVLSHSVAEDPVFNYANKTAQTLFEMTWDAFIELPSRLSAEPLVREERTRLLARVNENGYVDDYAGVRIASSGKRFYVKNVVVWNLLDETGKYYGQAAKIDHWHYIE